MKKILVTTDFSEHSKAGVRFAIQLAGQTGASLVFCHVTEMLKPVRWSAEYYASYKAAKAQASDVKMKRFVNGLLKGSRQPPEFTLYSVAGSKVYSTVIEAAQRLNADLICTSTKGAGKVRRLLGTNASSLVLHSPVPLAVVPHDYAPKKIRRLFYATDLASLPAETKTVRNLTLQLGATVEAYHYDYLLHVSDETSRLEKKVARYQSAAFTFTFKRQNIDLSLAEQLGRDIKKTKSDAVIIFTKQNRNWFERLISPGAAQDIAFNGRAPMLVFRKPLRVIK